MSANVLLINPAINPSSQNKVINAIINTTFPTSLGTLAGFLMNKKENPVNIIDEQLNFIKDESLPEIILSLQPPRIIGLSVLTINSQRAYFLADAIKKIDSTAIVVLGGIHPTVVPDEALQRKGVDIVVRGEGEETFYELVNLICNEEDYSPIAGISYARNGSITHNKDRAAIMDLDTLPPFPYYLFEYARDKYPSFGGIITSRGCPYSCTFCSSRSITGKRYRYFSIERVISEIKLLVNKYNQKTIWMMDDNIAGNRARFMRLLDAIIAAKLPENVSFHGSMRGDNLTDEILDRAKAVNFKMIAFGMETGIESLMSVVNKGETVKHVIDAINKTDQKGIAVATTLIFGLPGETRKDRRDTIKLVNSLPLASVRFNILTPYPGTPVFDMLKQKGEVYIKQDWENFAVQYMWESDDLAYVPKGTNRYELMFDTMIANLSFYLSFKGIKRMLKSSYAGGNVIKISGKWYSNSKMFLRFIHVAVYLIRRFLYITLKMLTSKFETRHSDKYAEIKENLEGFINDKINKKDNILQTKNNPMYTAYLTKVFENILCEKYVTATRPVYTYFPLNYQKIPARVRYNFQILFKNNKHIKNSFPAWPIEKSLEILRDIVLDSVSDNHKFMKLQWPKNKQSALILTHDIESSNNWQWVKKIAETEMQYGFRSLWNVVPKLYRINYTILDWLIENGFEIGLHGYNHDNKLAFITEEQIRKRFESVFPLISQYHIKGFRAPSWLRSEKLFKILQDYFVYDCSVLDVDYISPAGIGGCCSIFPYKIDQLVEIPTTLPYEFPIQCGILPANLNTFWSEKVEWIKNIKGAITVVTHPDPYYGGNLQMVDAYRKLLENFSQDNDIICMLPREVAEHYKGK